MRVVRINFSHGNHDCHCQYIQAARKAISMYVEQTGLPRTLAIALDTKGPEIRTGKISGDCDIQLQEGDQVILSTKKELRENCTKEKVYVDNQQLPGIIKPGNQIFLDEGLISLVVHESKGEEVICEVQSGGELGSHKDVNLPGTTIDLPSITEQDKLDLKFGAEQKVDMIFASFIRDAKAANEVRQALGSSGDHIKIISKIENQKGLANIDEIIRESDGIMIARGNMGIDMPIEDVPLAQKTIVAKCNKVGKPVICAAHMMDSMRNKPRPSRAEVSDVANAILDGFDAVMLSDETANGKYPVDCVKSMARICSKVESVLWYERLQFSLKNEIRSCPDYISSVTSAIAETATVIRAQAIVVACPCSIIALMISNMRPPCPIVMLSGCQSESAQSLISRGVHPILVEEMVNGSLNFRCIMQSGLKLMSKLDILEPGEQGTVVLVNAMSAENITFRLDSYRQQTKAERDEEERCRKLAFEQRCKEKAQKESCQEPKEPEECVKKCEPTVKCSKPEEKPKVCPKKECLKKHNKESNCLKVIEESRAREEAKKKRRDASKNAKSFPTNCMKSMENKCPKKEEEASKCSRLENQKQTKAENKCEKQSEIPEDSCEKCEMEEKTIACPKKECPTQDTESLICLKLKKERQAQQEAERKRREKSRKREETLRNRQAKERKLAEKCMKPKKKKCPKKDEEDEVSKCLNLNVQAQKKQKAEKDQKCESESAKNSCAEKEKPSVGPKRECPKDILALKCLQLKCEREAKLKAEKKRIEESKKCQKNKNTKKCILTEVRVKSGENPIVYPKWECPKKDNKAELAARKKQREECARPCEVKRKECKTLKLENCKLRKPEKTLKLVNCKQLCKNTKKVCLKYDVSKKIQLYLCQG
ncbi:uncharacterized protein LOC108109183 [Drosophila eugracilis]|uniref:uncharacterized protein LOC108109183 n=1 Tax=Drosophila eugracilis TaxID=29029 RepID=UPI001BDA5F4A|nr:uncharacterized protein LOC108109183 [Drosophila eugracilis]